MNIEKAIARLEKRRGQRGGAIVAVALTAIVCIWATAVVSYGEVVLEKCSPGDRLAAFCGQTFATALMCAIFLGIGIARLIDQIRKTSPIDLSIALWHRVNDLEQKVREIESGRPAQPGTGTDRAV